MIQKKMVLDKEITKKVKLAYLPYLPNDYGKDTKKSGHLYYYYIALVRAERILN